MEYVLDPESPSRIDQDKKMNLDKEIFLNYNEKISSSQLPTPEEEPDYFILPYIEFKDIYYKAPRKSNGRKWLSNIPGLNFSKIKLMDLLSEEGLRGNLENKYWDEVFSFDEQTRQSLYDYRIWPQEDFNMNNMELFGGTLQ
ncbi:hypothetical protein O181_089065 [Austropuccinia psidii MF-1]|uniref:Uncharacterized protein n=1 Tax=Austropuccinia psidii MF-1 TaxID=1389203 RepID=A0A9Q3P544_9BASI|nr:hypothetical protein [Austropuccinia psidii MF-1]